MNPIGHLTGFEVFVVAALFDISASVVYHRAIQTDSAGAMLSSLANGLVAMGLTIYWFVTYAWPAIT